MLIKNKLWTGLLAMACCAGCGPAASNHPSGIEHVFVIGVDGLSPDGIRRAPTPVMDRMMDSGAVKWAVRTVLPSSSSPNWASMLSGAGPEQHGVIDNDWERADHSLPPVIMDNEGIFPTIFAVIHRARPAAALGAVYQWQGFGRLFEKSALDHDSTLPTAEAAAGEYIRYIEAQRPLFAFLQLDHVDHAGHTFGHGSPEYYQAVAQADSLIGRILEGIRRAGILEHSLVIITADHGGRGYGHGGPTPEEAQVATIYYGKDIKKGYTIRQPVYTYDLAATIAYALGITPPYAWIGRPVRSAFQGGAEPDNLWTARIVLPPPLIFPTAYLYRQAGGLYLDSPARVRMQAPMEGGFIRYTLDGQEPDSGSALYQGPFELDSTAVVKARYMDEQGNESLTRTAYFRISTRGGGHGLTVSFFPGENWKALPDFRRRRPSHQWTAPEFELDRDQIRSLYSGEVFGVVMEGYLDIAQPGAYTFWTSSDDGSRLLVDGHTVVDNDGSHGVLTRSGDITLDKGRHSLRLEYFNGEGGFWVEAYFRGPGTPRQIIPGNLLYRMPR